MTDYADLVSQADRARADIAHLHQLHLWDGVDVSAALAMAEKHLVWIEEQLTAATIEVIHDIGTARWKELPVPEVYSPEWEKYSALSQKLDSARRYLAQLRQLGFPAVRWYHAPRFHG